MVSNKLLGTAITALGIAALVAFQALYGAPILGILGVIFVASGSLVTFQGFAIQ